MQLAANHRPHPPPVPPRPSRQVVAEALKRSPPRPPCPTRQAPPPPNTKPWRPGDKQILTKYTPGRTVIYESAKDIKDQQINQKQLIKCNKNNSCGSVKTQECRGGKSERTPATENQRERQQQPAQSSSLIINGMGNDHENFLGIIKKNGENRLDKKAAAVAVAVVDLSMPIRSLTEDENRKDVVTTQCALQVDRVQGTNGHMGEYNTQSNTKEFDTVTDGNKDNLKKEKKKEVKGDENLKKKEYLEIITNMVDVTEKNNNNNNDDDNNVINDLEVPITILSSIKSNILTDECATVVVIDEPERKITFNEDNNDNIQHQDWLEAGVRYSSTKIMLPGDDSSIDRANELEDDQPDGEIDEKTQFDLDFSSIRERIAMSSLQGLPPLPRSLSGFNLNEGRREGVEPPPPPTRSSSKTQKGGKTPTPSSSRPSPPGRQLTTLDTQLAILRKEMFGLRQLDLSLLSQLWSLNESIQEFRQLLQDQEDRAPSPSPSSEEGEDGSYSSHPPPPPRRPAPLVHHHRPPRPPRPLRPPPSDESPSSEEYGAV